MKVSFFFFIQVAGEKMIILNKVKLCVERLI